LQLRALQAADVRHVTYEENERQLRAARKKGRRGGGGTAEGIGNLVASAMKSNDDEKRKNEDEISISVSGI